MPDWYVALVTMGLDRAVSEVNTRLFSYALMTHMAIIVEGGRLSAGAKTAIKSFLQERGTGPANAGRILILEDERNETKITFEKLNLDIKDTLIVEAQCHFRDVVIRRMKCHRAS